MLRHINFSIQNGYQMSTFLKLYSYYIVKILLLPVYALNSLKYSSHKKSNKVDRHRRLFYIPKLLSKKKFGILFIWLNSIFSTPSLAGWFGTL